MSYLDDPSSSTERFGSKSAEGVRILIVGDGNLTLFNNSIVLNILEGVGKTSIIMALVHDNFCTNVPARCEQVLIPRDVSPDGVLTEIIDYSRITKFVF